MTVTQLPFVLKSQESSFSFFRHYICLCNYGQIEDKYTWITRYLPHLPLHLEVYGEVLPLRFVIHSRALSLLSRVTFFLFSPFFFLIFQLLLLFRLSVANV